MAIFGSNTTGAGYESINNNVAYGCRFNLSEPGVVTQISIECYSSYGASFKGVIWSAEDSSVKAVGSATSISASKAFRHSSVDNVTLQAGYYYIGLVVNNTTGFYYNVNGNTYKENNNNYSSPAALSGGSGGSGRECSFYATYDPLPAYEISGTKSETARIIVFDESDWSIESNTVVSGSGVYEIDMYDTNTRTVIAKSNSGELLGYGNITPVAKE
jgi:hypothetical protein